LQAAMALQGPFVIEPDPKQYFHVGMHGTTNQSARDIGREGFNPTNYEERGRRYPAWSGVYLSTDPTVCQGYGDTMLYVYVRKDQVDTRNLEAFYWDYAESDPNMSLCDRGAQERIWLEDAKLLRISQQPPKDMETLPLRWGDIHEDGS